MSSIEIEELDLATVLSLLGSAVDDAVLAALDGTGLRRGHGYVVQRLLGGPASATEIALDLGVTQQAVSKVVKELIGLGHVEPIADPADGRRRPVRLTARGRRAVSRARRARASVDRRLHEALGERSAEQTRQALITALDALGLADQVRGRSVRPRDGALIDG